MPTYSYRCQSCGVVFDKVQKFSDKALTRCPECRTGTVRRILQPPAIVFKGSGWYSTDHRSPSGASSARKAESESKAAESSSSEKTDSSGAKTESKKSETTAAKTESKTESKSESKPAKKSED